ncbi:putative bifunctional diguanylate cyclase/phosphodiesterase [Paractinoplanes lichenicola]|uniref:EAL domain-containing protein n=1 Tax=Paractinoplanes lichenicola TaxID=2802976 RepID=A0ABS1VSK2_9ACTN|nr:EAL domain-containing protein [Actinoplanes lichenicola]MBL7257504.1 EAL domain-containing protein [Actinoplanes lichenicola]
MTAGLLVCAGYLLLPDGHIASTVIYNGLGVLSFVMIIGGIRHHRPVARHGWWLFAAGTISYVTADIVYEVSGHILGHHPYPYWDDLIYFSAYPILLAGLLMISRGEGKRENAGIIDAAILAAGVGLVYWVFVIQPTLSDTGTPLLERLVAVGYPTCDVLMCAVVTRLLSRSGARALSLWLLALGCALNFTCDVAWSLTQAFSNYSGGLINAGFMVAYVLWAGAALHPSMRDIGRRTGRARFGRGRLLLLGGVTMTVPAVLFLQGGRGDTVNWAAVGVGAVVLFLLVMTRLGGFVGQTQRQSAKLEELAMRDDLTGLANRRLFELRLRAATAIGTPQVCLLDLNGFKQVNDRLGHAVGDHLLIAVAARLGAELHGEGVLARMGGDEYALLLADATDEQGDAVVERLAQALRRPFEVDGHELLIGAAIGIADGSDPVDLLRRADVAMYAAKTGKARFRRYSVELDDRAGEEARLGAEMRAALDNGQFHLVYQPIVSLPEGELRYVETLIRWTHPARGFVSPAEFVPVAERNGLIVELGEWILRTACCQFMAWQASHGAAAPCRISVNVSARQLAEPGFAAVVADALTGCGMPADQLIVEVTETAVFGGGVALRAVEELHELGVKIALDDFGTGHSSLTLLQIVPVDVLKVDKSFVDNITEAGRHAVIATALIQVSDGLGLTAVAEGVETAEQAASLFELGYRYAQGYHFGRPVAQPTFHDEGVAA